MVLRCMVLVQTSVRLPGFSASSRARAVSGRMSVGEGGCIHLIPNCFSILGEVEKCPSKKRTKYCIVSSYEASFFFLLLGVSFLLVLVCLYVPPFL